MHNNQKVLSLLIATALAGEFGTIVEGVSADLVLLDANPLEDIGNARGIAGVMLRGDWWPRPRIERELAAIQAEYAQDAEMLATQSQAAQ